MVVATDEVMVATGDGAVEGRWKVEVAGEAVAVVEVVAAVIEVVVVA